MGHVGVKFVTVAGGVAANRLKRHDRQAFDTCDGKVTMSLYCNTPQLNCVGHCRCLATVTQSSRQGIAESTQF
jgi:hypothetical protein